MRNNSFNNEFNFIPNNIKEGLIDSSLIRDIMVGDLNLDEYEKYEYTIMMNSESFLKFIGEERIYKKFRIEGYDMMVYSNIENGILYIVLGSDLFNLKDNRIKITWKNKKDDSNEGRL